MWLTMECAGHGVVSQDGLPPTEIRLKSKGLKSKAFQRSPDQSTPQWPTSVANKISSTHNSSVEKIGYMLRKLILGSILLTTLPTFGLTLTWEQCLDLVLKNNKELLSKQADFSASVERVGISENGYYPHVSGSLNYSLIESQEPESTSSKSYGAGLALSQNLFTGFADENRIREAEARSRETEKDVQLLEARLSKDLKIAFENHQHATRLISLQNSIVERRKNNVRLVTLRFEGGRENLGSVSLSKATLSEARLELTQAKLSLRRSKVALSQILGLADYEDLDLEGAVPIAPLPSADLKLIPLSMETPAVSRAQASEEAEQAIFNVKRSAFFPNLSLFAGLNRGDDQFFPNDNQNWKVEAVLSIPIFNGGRDHYETRAQSQVILSKIHQRVKVQQEVLTNLETAFNELLIADERVKVNKEFVDAAKVRSEIAQMRYNNGLLTFEDWYIIENELISRERIYLDSQRDRVHKEAIWEETQGRSAFR